MTRSGGAWKIWAALLAASLGARVAHAGTPCPDEGQAPNSLWTKDKMATGTPSAATIDGSYRGLILQNALPGSVAYITSGNTLYAICNVDMQRADFSTCLEKEERWSRSFGLVNTQNFPTPVPIGTPDMMGRFPTHAIYLAEQSGFVRGFDAETGADLPNWGSGVDTRLCGTDQVVATPAVQIRAFSNATFQTNNSEDVVIVITRTNCDDYQNRIIAYGASSGAVSGPLWTYVPQSDGLTMGYGSEGGSLDYQNNLIYFSTNSVGGQHTLWAIRTAPSDGFPAGTRKWSRNAGALRARPATRGNHVYVVNYPGSMRAYRLDSVGTPLYTFAVTAGANVVRNIWPEFRNGFSHTTYSTDFSGFLHSMLEIDNGPILDQPCGYAGAGTGVCGSTGFAATNLGGTVNSMPAVSPTNGKMYVGLTDGTLHQVNAATGTHEGNGVVPGTVFDPTLDVVDGAEDANRVMAAATSGGENPTLRRFCTPFTSTTAGTTSASYDDAPRPLNHCPRYDKISCGSDTECGCWEHPPCSRGVCNLKTHVCEEQPANDGDRCNDGNPNTCQRLGTNGLCQSNCTDCDVCIDGQCTGTLHPISRCDTVAATKNPDKNCPYGQGCCMNAQGAPGCVNIADDVMNCGGCGYDCRTREPDSNACKGGVCIRQ